MFWVRACRVGFIGEMRNNNSTINKRLRISFPLQQKFPEKNKEKGNCPSFYLYTYTSLDKNIYVYSNNVALIIS